MSRDAALLANHPAARAAHNQLATLWRAGVLSKAEADRIWTRVVNAGREALRQMEGE